MHSFLPCRDRFSLRRLCSALPALNFLLSRRKCFLEYDAPLSPPRTRRNFGELSSDGRLPMIPFGTPLLLFPSAVNYNLITQRGTFHRPQVEEIETGKIRRNKRDRSGNKKHAASFVRIFPGTIEVKECRNFCDRNHPLCVGPVPNGISVSPSFRITLYTLETLFRYYMYSRKKFLGNVRSNFTAEGNLVSYDSLLRRITCWRSEHRFRYRLYG